MILPGQSQAGRDLQAASAADADWVRLATRSLHSYEARAAGGALWSASGGARLERVSGSLVVQQIGTDDGLPGARGHAVRWIASAAQSTDFLRVTGPPGVVQGTAPYTLDLFDTTYAFPRWNNSATQVTVFFVQNHTGAVVEGSVGFFTAEGTLLYLESMAIPADGLLVFNTSTIPELAGRSGSARIAQTGGVGALSGKAVSLEPSTGFTFDTALVPVHP